MTSTRLNKFLSENGICSRRQADEHILAKEVKINDTIAELGDRVDPKKDNVHFKGKLVRVREQQFVYYALYKPRGVISTSSDEAGRQNVTDLVPKTPRVYPVGRLDKDSEGLILLTNDGALANELICPKFEHEKEYEVEVKSQNSEIKIASKNLKDITEKFERGIMIDGKLMQAKSVRIKPLKANYYMLNAILTTGHNRQIRKMCAKMDLEVLKLTRIKIGELELEKLNLKPGEYKKVDKKLLISK